MIEIHKSRQIYSENNHPNQKVLESFFSKPLLRRVLKQVSERTDGNNFYSGIWLRLLFYFPSDGILKLLQADQEPENQMSFGQIGGIAEIN